MFIGFFKLPATLSATVFISVFVKGQNPNVYKWPEAESNCRPLVFQTSALPTELSGRMAGTTGFEPATSAWQAGVNSRLHHAPVNLKYNLK